MEVHLCPGKKGDKEAEGNNVVNEGNKVDIEGSKEGEGNNFVWRAIM
jgi:hypothetical protein